MSSAKKRLIIVANRTGGQGKTLVSQLALHALAEGNKAVIPLSADVQSIEPGSPEGSIARSKLAKILPGAIDLGIGPSVTQVGGKAERVSYWDKLGNIALAGHALVDVGANVIDGIIDWAIDSDARSALEDDLAIDIVVPVTCNSQPIADARSMLDKLFTTRCLPLRNVYVVRNMFGASTVAEDDFIELVVHFQKEALASLAAERPAISGGVILVDLAACDSGVGSTMVSNAFEQSHWYLGVLSTLGSERSPVPNPLGVSDADIVRSGPTHPGRPKPPSEEVLSALHEAVNFCLPPSQADLDFLAGKTKEAPPAAARLASARAAMTEKFRVDGTAFAASLGSLNAFQRARERKYLLAWLKSFVETLKRVGFVEGATIQLPAKFTSRSDAAKSPGATASPDQGDGVVEATHGVGQEVIPA